MALARVMALVPAMAPALALALVALHPIFLVSPPVGDLLWLLAHLTGAAPSSCTYAVIKVAAAAAALELPELLSRSPVGTMISCLMTSGHTMGRHACQCTLLLRSTYAPPCIVQLQLYFIGALCNCSYV